MFSFLLCLTTCLAALATGDGERGWIVGGEEAEPHSIPFQVSLRRKSDDFHFCGGSVLGSGHVVTAAHCSDWMPEEVEVVAGEHDRSVDEGTEQRRGVVSDGTCRLEYPFSIADSMICAGERARTVARETQEDPWFVTMEMGLDTWLGLS